MYQAKSHLNQIPVMYRAAEDEPVGGRIGFLQPQCDRHTSLSFPTALF